MKKFTAYNTKDNFGAERFDIYDENDETMIVEAETEEEAYKVFENYLYETSLYSDEETAEWIENNPIFVIEL